MPAFSLDPMERVFRRGLAAFRWGAWIWMTATLAIYWNDDYIRHRWAAAILVALALAFTVVQTALVPVSIRFTNRRRVAFGELAVGLSIMALDGYVRNSSVLFETGPTLGSWWPVIGLVSAATYFRLPSSIIAGLFFGVARLWAVSLNHIALSDLTSSQWLSVADTGVFAALLAASITGLMKLLRNSESEVALVRAREEVARTLHDGVLQTLTVVERRATDDDLVQLARDQQRSLRVFLFGQQETIVFNTALAEAASRFESVYGGKVQLVVADDLPELSDSISQALAGAIGEALTNAGKHGEATTVTVYIEPEGEFGVFCSIKDNGAGFDVATAQESVGMSRSIKGRIADAGGRTEVKSSPGQGAEVLIWLP